MTYTPITPTQVARYERRRAERERAAQARRSARNAIWFIVLAITIMAIGSCVLAGPSEVELMQLECDEWAARGVNIFE